ncbi:MAG: hypothetical protein ACTHU0_30730 [Kofleriaceae bacterium]
MPEQTTRAPQLFDIPAGADRTTCRSCQAPIWFIVTAKGHRMPVSVAVEGGVAPTDSAPGRGISHFVDCPARDQHRRRK